MWRAIRPPIAPFQHEMKTTSHGWKSGLLRFFGSVKLAMTLLTVVIVACIVGTFVESRLDTTIAQAYVYDAPWFIAWLLLLCVNLICAVVVRYPWKSHQTGFIITHGGIVVILLGGVIGRIWGIEGNMTLLAGAPPQNFLVVNETLIQVQPAGSTAIKSFPLNLQLRPPTEQRPARFKAENVEIAVLNFAEELGVRQVFEPSPARGVPALRLVMSGGNAPHALDRWMVQDDPRRGLVTLGPNIIRFTTENEPLEPLATGPAPSREVHFSFAKLSGMNISRVLSGTGSSAVFEYRFAPEGKTEDRGVLHIELDGKKFEFSINDAAGRTLPLENTPWTLRALRYFADFRMEGKAPVSVSEEPNNPAIVFELIGPPVEAGNQPTSAAVDHSNCDHDANPHEEDASSTHVSVAARDDSAACPHSGTAATGGEASCSHGPGDDADCAHSSKAGSGKGDGCCSQTTVAGTHQHGHDRGHPHVLHGGTPGNELVIRFVNGELVYESRSEKGITSGELAVGSEIPVGWENWKVRVEQFFEKASVREEVAPMAAGMRSLKASGIYVKVKNAVGDSVERWVQMGSTAFLHVGSEHLHLGFGYRLYPLNFNVVLDRFEVEFNEGTQTPASFKSHVRFLNEKTGEALGRQVWMNNPANYPHFPGVGFLGTSYKFSQSSWNPGDLTQSTLQVIRDPGWSLKWIGSLLLCAGLFTMFYLRPYPRRTKTSPARAEADSPSVARDEVLTVK
jgi:hypothetical protein